MKQIIIQKKSKQNKTSVLVKITVVSVGCHLSICYPQFGDNDCSQCQAQKEDLANLVLPNITVLLVQQPRKKATEEGKQQSKINSYLLIGKEHKSQKRITNSYPILHHSSSPPEP